MKKFTIFVVMMLAMASLYCQAPQKMSYQLVIRNSSNQLVTNHLVGMQVSILQGSSTGAAVYIETQTPVTNVNGLVSIKVGEGTVVFGDFSSINWANGPYYIKTGTDPSGGTDYTQIVGTNQLLSVPYALYSGSSASNGWALTGNALTNPTTNFLGTTDSIPFTIKVNNQKAGRIDPGDGSSFFGYKAGNSNNTTSTYGGNTGIGYQAMQANTTGFQNTAIGYLALNSNTVEINNTAAGWEALRYDTAGFNTAFGTAALFSNISGDRNTGIGMQALYTNSSGTHNTAVGDGALYSNTTAGENTGVGHAALNANTTGIENTAIGSNALVYNTTGQYNTATGYEALQNNVGGNNNTANGYNANSNNTSGNNNTADGFEALLNNHVGSGNTAMGYASLANTTTDANTAVGYNALIGNTTGGSNTALGYATNVSTGGLLNATAIGYGATVNGNTKIRLGNPTIQTIEGQVAYTYPSDGRFKYDVKEEVKGLDFIMKLRPVVYNFDTRKFDEFLMKNMSEEVRSNIMKRNNYSESSAIVHTGFIAQEVEEAVKKCGFTFDGVNAPRDENGNYGIAYSQFVVPLVKAVQEQQAIIENQNKKIDELQKQIDELKALIKK